MLIYVFVSSRTAMSEKSANNLVLVLVILNTMPTAIANHTGWVIVSHLHEEERLVEVWNIAIEATAVTPTHSRLPSSRAWWLPT